jgi:crotonobetainyl-CoA:carnitine CoA-transferase CaiB-like acyl-CoA transferase
LSEEQVIPANIPLAGVKVVELGTSVAAPYAGWILAALGADVVKIERPDGGDDARQWGTVLADGSSSYYNAFNRDKRGITIDIKSDEEREWLRTYCVEQADVVIQNMRPGGAEKNGLGAAELTALNPRLVYCNMGAFGRVGPMRERPGYDPLMQAYGGIMSVTGEEGRPPIRVGTSLVDMGTGMWSVIGILSALNRRTATGEGTIIDSSLYETALGWMTHHTSTVQATGENPVKQGSGARGMSPYQAYQCSDGWLVIAAPNDRLFAKVATVLGHPQWPDEPRFASNQQRYAHQDELNALLEPLLITRTRDQWRLALEEAGVPTAPVRTTLEMMEDAQTRALGMLQRLDDEQPEMMGLPISFGGERPPMHRFAPALGEHNDEVKK